MFKSSAVHDSADQASGTEVDGVDYKLLPSKLLINYFIILPAF